jgi:hypothetical protein
MKGEVSNFWFLIMGAKVNGKICKRKGCHLMLSFECWSFVYE